MSKTKEEKPRRPQWLVFMDDDACQQAVATDFVSGIFVTKGGDEAALCIETSGGTKIMLSDMTPQQANQAANHVKYMLAIPQFGRGDVADLNRVVLAAKKAVPAPAIVLAD